MVFSTSDELCLWCSKFSSNRPKQLNAIVFRKKGELAVFVFPFRSLNSNSPFRVVVRVYAKPLRNARCVSLKSRMVRSKSDAQNTCVKLKHELVKHGWKPFNIIAVRKQEPGETQQLKGIKSKLVEYPELKFVSSELISHKQPPNNLTNQKQVAWTSGLPCIKERPSPSPTICPGKKANNIKMYYCIVSYSTELKISD